MFDVGFAELFLLALIGLMVLGPERLPQVARTLGGFVRKARASWNSLRHTIESELAEADVSTPIKQAGDELRQIGKNLSDIPDFIADKPASEPTQPETGADASEKTGETPEKDNGKIENA